MVMRNHCIFLAPSNDDSVENESGDIVVPSGRTLISEIAKYFDTFGSPFQCDHYGWEFVYRNTSNQRISVLLQGSYESSDAAVDDWLIIVSPLPNWLVWGSARRRMHEEAIRMVDEAIRSLPGVSVMSWLTDDEFAKR